MSVSVCIKDSISYLQSLSNQDLFNIAPSENVDNALMPAVNLNLDDMLGNLMIQTLDSDLPTYARWLADMRSGGEQDSRGMVYLYLNETGPIESFADFLRVGKVVGSSVDRRRLAVHEDRIKTGAKNFVSFLMFVFNMLFRPLLPNSKPPSLAKMDVKLRDTSCCLVCANCQCEFPNKQSKLLSVSYSFSYD